MTSFNPSLVIFGRLYSMLMTHWVCPSVIIIIFIETRLQDAIARIINTDHLINRLASGVVTFESSP